MLKCQKSLQIVEPDFAQCHALPLLAETVQPCSTSGHLQEKSDSSRGWEQHLKQDHFESKPAALPLVPDHHFPALSAFPRKIFQQLSAAKLLTRSLPLSSQLQTAPAHSRHYFPPALQDAEQEHPGQPCPACAAMAPSLPVASVAHVRSFHPLCKQVPRPIPRLCRGRVA